MQHLRLFVGVLPVFSIPPCATQRRNRLYC